jgi:hypothetical protein
MSREGVVRVRGCPIPKDVTFSSVSMSGPITADLLESHITRIRTASSVKRKLRTRAVQKVKAGSTLRIAVTLEPVDGSDEQVVKLKTQVARGDGTYGVHLRGGKRRYSFDTRAGSFDALLADLNDSDIPNEIVLSGGVSGLFTQDVIVRGDGSFKIQVV